MLRKSFFLIVLFHFGNLLNAQSDSVRTATVRIDTTAFAPDFTKIDSLYREDQFYTGFTYNILAATPSKLSQNKFSLGFTIGFLRDFPINRQRNKAIAVGLGYGLQNYNYNLVATQTDAGTSYAYIGDDQYYEKNKLSLNYVELPVEFRWRTSVPQSHKFWRVYTGVKAGYLFYSRNKFTGDGGKNLIINNKDLNALRFSAYVAAGYNTWNFYVCYAFSPIYKSGTVEGQNIGMTNVNVGLMFYIL